MMIPRRVKKALKVYREALHFALSVPPAADVRAGKVKGVATRVVENLVWAHKKREANENYYVYGLHIKGGPGPERFMSNTEAMRIVARQLHACKDPYDIMRDKLRFFEVASRFGAPVPEIVYAYRTEGLQHVQSGAPRTWNEVAREAEGDRLFAKPARGQGGEGGGFVSFRAAHTEFEGKRITADQVAHFQQARYIFQRGVPQHSDLARFNPACLNTMRIVTIARGGEVVPLAGFFRIGAPGKSTDNWATGGIAVSLDLERGTLSGDGIYKFGLKPSTPTHPESGIKFDGYPVPFIREALDEISRLHQAIGCLRSVGWDVAIGPNGPWIVEGNTYWGAMFFQAADHDFKRKYLDLLADPHPA